MVHTYRYHNNGEPHYNNDDISNKKQAIQIQDVDIKLSYTMGDIVG